MGNNKSKKQPRQTELSSVNSDVDDFYQEYFEVKNCCGVQYKRSVKSTLTWEINFIKNCNELSGQYPWTQSLKQYVQNTQISRLRFIREFNEIKYNTEISSMENAQQTPLNSSQIEDFKQNLRKSVLLCYGPGNQKEKQNGKIQSIMVTPHTARQSRKKANYLSQFKKSVIVNQSTKSSNRGTFRSSIRTFIDDTMTELLKQQRQQISKQSAHLLQNFVKFTLLIQRHLNDPQHKLCQVIKLFQDYIYKKYCHVQLATPQIIQGLINTIKLFLVLLRESVQDFYNTKNFEDMNKSPNYLISNSQNTLTAVTTILFKDTKFYKFIYALICKFNAQRREILVQIFGKLQNKNPQFFQVKPEYCLNTTTIKNYIESMSSVESTIQNLQPSQLQSNGQQPYIRCAEALQMIKKTRTPVSKMKTIIQCAEKITESVNQFYVVNDLHLKSKMMDADQVLSIFCYIIASAKIADIHTHMFFIEHFATQNQLISATGYYYSVMRGAIEQLQNQYNSL